MTKIQSQTVKSKTKTIATRRVPSTATRHAVFRRDDFKCVICGVHAEVEQLMLNALVPISDGGTTTIDNLITVCRTHYNVREGGGFVSLSGQTIKKSYYVRRKIAGVICDTEKSTCVHEMLRTTAGDNKTKARIEQLYKTRDGVFFLLCFDESPGIEAIKDYSLNLLSLHEAREWLDQDAQTMLSSQLLEKQVTSNFTLRLPTPLKEQLGTIAKSKDMRLHALIVKILQDAVALKDMPAIGQLYLEKDRKYASVQDALEELKEAQLIQMQLADRMAEIISK